MGLKVRINAQGALDELKQFSNVNIVINAVADYMKLPKDASALDKGTKLFAIATAVVTVIQANRIQSGITAENAIDTAVKTLDALFVVEGTLFGILPVGAIIEAYDNIVMNLIVKAAYEAIRGRFVGTSKEVFNSKVVETVTGSK